jgi:outer membrane protein OmpA-like peptidoglycan-associated protein
MLTEIRKSGTFYLLLAVLAGCATRGMVRHEVSRLEAREASLAGLQSRLDSLTAAIEEEGKLLQARGEQVASASSQALLASDQATDAEAQARGHLLGEAVFRVGGLRFEPGTAILTAESRTVLDQLVERLRAEDAAYYLEVQSRATNGADGRAEGLEGARAEAVRRYLHGDRGLPLHALSTLATAGELPSSAPAVAGALEAEEAASMLEIEPAAGEAALAVVVVRPFPRP